MVEISEFSYDNPRFKNLLARKPGSSEDVEKTVSEVIKNIKENGDKALFFI
jgi:histidinol dehydrogenase